MISINKIIKLITKKKISSFIKKGVKAPNIGEINILIFFGKHNVAKFTSINRRKIIMLQKIKTSLPPILNAKKVKAKMIIEDINLTIRFDKILDFQNIILFNL